MVFVYAIRNFANNEIYVGISKDVNKRLNEHNNGKNRYTKAYMPWEIFFTEEHPDYASARKREIYFKNASGKRFLKNLISQV
ncbi:MAG: GIY-YIG nuclease superfamily protein [Bacteroidetes bacterium ADurb.Bin408]|nr:MAG: GIY-YIG nuclease superfamily protein [Bacteroidetes bacterium ADurb.Bin408]